MKSLDVEAVEMLRALVTSKLNVVSPEARGPAR